MSHSRENEFKCLDFKVCVFTKRTKFDSVTKTRHCKNHLKFVKFVVVKYVAEWIVKVNVVYVSSETESGCNGKSTNKALSLKEKVKRKKIFWMFSGISFRKKMKESN